MMTELADGRRRPPRHLVAPLRRWRLHRTLDACRAAGQVTVVAAPAGAGKTTLLADWAAKLREEERPTVRVAWLTADRDEGDPHLFWLAVIDAVRNAGVAVSDRPGHAIRALAPARCVVAMGMLAAEIAAQPDALVFILDRHDQLTDPDVTAGLIAFAARLPPAMHLVVAHDSPGETADPDGPVREVDGFGEVATGVITADELALDPAEAEALVDQLTPAKAPVGRITASVTDRSAIAVVFAAAASRGQRRASPPADAALSAATLSDAGSSVGHVGDARAPRTSSRRRNQPAQRRGVDEVTAEALARVTLRQYRFLVETSFLDPVSAPLADAVRGGRDSARILGELVRRGLPIEETAAEGAWYRYHPVLRQALKADHWADPESARTRLDRAARWFAAAGEPGQAIRYAVAAGDHEQAARILAGLVGPLVERGSPRARRVLVDLVDRAAVARDSLVCLMMAVALVEDGRAEAAQAWLDYVDTLPDSTLPDSPATIAGWHSVKAAATTVRAATWRAGTAPERCLEAGRNAVALGAATGGTGWVVAQIALGLAQTGLDRVDEGIETLAAALGHANDVNLPLVASLPAAGTLASALIGRRRMIEAHLLVMGTRSAVNRVVNELGVGAGPAVSELILADAALAAEDGQFAAARETLDLAAALAPAAGYTSQVELARADLSRAQRPARRG